MRMNSTRIVIAMERDLIRRVDRLVSSRRYPSRSRAIQSVVAEALPRLEESRLDRECAKLDPQEEQALADEGMAELVEGLNEIIGG